MDKRCAELGQNLHTGVKMAVHVGAPSAELYSQQGSLLASRDSSTDSGLSQLHPLPALPVSHDICLITHGKGRCAYQLRQHGGSQVRAHAPTGNPSWGQQGQGVEAQLGVQHQALQCSQATLRCASHQQGGVHSPPRAVCPPALLAVK